MLLLYKTFESQNIVNFVAKNICCRVLRFIIQSIFQHEARKSGIKQKTFSEQKAKDAVISHTDNLIPSIITELWTPPCCPGNHLSIQLYMRSGVESACFYTAWKCSCFAQLFPLVLIRPLYICITEFCEDKNAVGIWNELMTILADRMHWITNKVVGKSCS